MNILYINYDGINCSVYSSQIYTFCRLLSPKNLITLVNCDITQEKKEYKDNMKTLSLKKNKRFDFLISKKIISGIKKIIKEEYLEDEKIIIHCRGVFGSYIGLKVRRKLNNFNIKVVSDFRGAVIEEYLERHKDKNLIYKIVLKFIIFKINRIHSYVCENSDYILCVSKKLEEYLRRRYIVNCNISIIPTSIDTKKNKFDLDERRKLRKGLNLENKFVLTYCGGGQVYQNIEGLITTFIKIGGIVEESFFLVLTKDKEIFEKKFKEFNIDKGKYLIFSAPFKEIYKYLSVADLAILLRKKNIVNKVSSPTKFGEYINCKLPVLLSSGIGDIDEINRKYNTCIYEKDICNIKEKISHINKNRENFNSLIEKYYDWNKNMNTIIQIYNEI